MSNFQVIINTLYLLMALVQLFLTQKVYKKDISLEPNTKDKNSILFQGLNIRTSLDKYYPPNNYLISMEFSNDNKFKLFNR